MEEPTPTNPVAPIEPPPESLQIKEGDSKETRSAKKLLSEFSWEQKVRLATLVLIFIAIPFSIFAALNATKFLPQAKTPKPPLVVPGLTPPITPTPSPTPSPTPTP